MKKKTNIKAVIRKIVREEVAMAIHEVITELKLPTQQVSKPKQKRKIVEKQQNYTKNPILNDVLNETAGDGDWKSITSNGAGKTLDSLQNTLSDSYGDMMGSSQDINVDEMAADANVNPEAVPDHVTNALTRDYSELMKAVDKRKESK
jgi:hypothetical protein